MKLNYNVLIIIISTFFIRCSINSKDDICYNIFFKKTGNCIIILEKGDFMKIKTWYLFAFIIVLFGCSFFVINQKFDKFYRVNGINNDNRVLIEQYLNKSEQTYLIDNQIQIDLFIRYIKDDQFQLQNYQYYNALEETNHYKTISNIVEMGNSLATRLNYLYHDDAFDYAKLLFTHNLEGAFLANDQFNFDYIEYYADMKKLYTQTDYTYIDDTHKYIIKLNTLGITTEADLRDVFSKLTSAYSKKSLQYLMNKNLKKGINIVYNPHETTATVDSHHYIGIYEPRSLLLTQDIPRARYAMYLQSDAYDALLKMYNDLSDKYNGFVLKEGYLDPQSMTKKDVGYNEFQLGFSINVMKAEVAYKDFEHTDISKWLEKHAYEYGFILRYPEHKASITNHAYDAHIYRYVGKSLAKSLHDEELTLEEYSDVGK